MMKGDEDVNSMNRTPLEVLCVSRGERHLEKRFLSGWIAGKLFSGWPGSVVSPLRI